MKKTVVFTCLLLIVLLTGCIPKMPEVPATDTEGNSKIVIREYDLNYLTDPTNYMMPSLAHWGGTFEVFIFCDYSKHEKYAEWVEEYGLKGSYEREDEKFFDHYYSSLNGACYELIKDQFPNGKYSNVGIGEFLYFIYGSEENWQKDYLALENIAKQDYVTGITIQAIDYTAYSEDI